jgi:hypothetical protein
MCHVGDEKKAVVRCIGRFGRLVDRLRKSPACRATQTTDNERLLYRKTATVPAPAPQTTQNRHGVAASRVTGGGAPTVHTAAASCGGATAGTAAANFLSGSAIARTVAVRRYRSSRLCRTAPSLEVEQADFRRRVRELPLIGTPLDLAPHAHMRAKLGSAVGG